MREQCIPGLPRLGTRLGTTVPGNNQFSIKATHSPLALSSTGSSSSLQPASIVRKLQREKMKTALAGLCLLALTLTTSDALDKKQNAIDCANQGMDVTECLASLSGSDVDRSSFCSGSYSSTLEVFYDACDPTGQSRATYDNFCSSAATVGATLFTIVSAVLVAVGN